MSHPATDKRLLRFLLGTTAVATTVTLERVGLLRASEWLHLPRTTRTCRTRVTQSNTNIDLTFVALAPAALELPTRDLMHQAAVAECMATQLTQGEGTWRLTPQSGVTVPDAEILSPLSNRLDCAVEIDLGYPPKVIRRKLEAFCEHGYSRILWATSIHARTVTVVDIAQELRQENRLPGLVSLETRYLNFWSTGDPYAERRRNSKPMAVTYDPSSGTVTRRTRP